MMIKKNVSNESRAVKIPSNSILQLFMVKLRLNGNLLYNNLLLYNFSYIFCLYSFMYYTNMGFRTYV